MAYTPIDALPEAPIRGDVPATFATKANAFVAALPTLRTQINNAGDYFDTEIPLALADATASANAASASALAAATSESNCITLEATVVGTANFKGLWADLVGALNKPASVAHNDQIWVLLNNLANVTTSEPGVTGDWQVAVAPPTSVSIDVTANSNGITAGNVVELVSTGGQNVQNIYHCEAPTISSLLTLDGTNNCAYFSIAAGGSSNALLAYQDSSNQVCRSVFAGSPPTYTPKLTLATGNRIPTICRLTDTQFASVVQTSSSNIVTSIVTTDGTNVPTKSTDSAAIIASTSALPSICKLTPSSWFLAYGGIGGVCPILTVLGNGTNAPTIGTALNVNGTNSAAYLSLANTSTTTAMLVLQNATDSNGEIAHITGGTTNAPTASTLAHLDGTNNCNFITQSPIDSNHTLCAYNNATTSNGCLAVIQANGTNAPTVISRAVFETNGISYTGLTQFSSTTYGLIYTNVDVSPYEARSRAINVDSNYNVTITSYLRVSGTNNSSYEAIASLSPTTAIVAFQDSIAGNDGFAGSLTLTPTPVISGQLVGIAQTSATNGATASVAVGPLVSGTFTAGLDYYASGSGGLTTNATPVHVLKAKSTTEGVLELRGAPEAGKSNVWEIIVPGAFTWTAPEDGKYTLIECGGGGSGARHASSTQARGGNGANSIRIETSMKLSSSLSGTIGAGGAGQTSAGNNGVSGGNSTLVLAGTTHTALGGLGGDYNTFPTNSVSNLPNSMTTLNIMGSTGFVHLGLGYSYGGVSLLSSSGAESLAQSQPVSGKRGGGGSGCGSNTTSGAGGDGVLRIEHIWGDK